MKSAQATQSARPARQSPAPPAASIDANACDADKPCTMSYADAHPDAAPTAAADQGQPQTCTRRAGRFTTTGLTCSLGKVLDLSRDGMRIQARRVPAGIVTVELTDRNIVMYLNAEVIWSKRVGLFKHEFGVRFLDLPREAVTQLALIAQARSRTPSV